MACLQVSPSFSKTYLGRVRKRIDTLAYGSERGTVREEAGVGVRVIGIMGPISVAFVVTDTRVVVLRILYRGQDWQSALTTEAEN